MEMEKILGDNNVEKIFPETAKAPKDRLICISRDFPKYEE